MFTWENKENGMSVVIEKLPHPYKLTQQITKKMEEAFFFFFLVKGFVEREEREKSFKIFLNFSSLFSPLFFTKNFFISHKKNGGGIYRRNEENGG